MGAQRSRPVAFGRIFLEKKKADDSEKFALKQSWTTLGLMLIGYELIYYGRVPCFASLSRLNARSKKTLART